MVEYIDKWQAVANLMDAHLKDTGKAVDAIQYMDAADVRPVVHAVWIPVDEKEDAFDCSECDAMVSKRCNFCPGCGADMRKVEGDG